MVWRRMNDQRERKSEEVSRKKMMTQPFLNVCNAVATNTIERARRNATYYLPSANDVHCLLLNEIHC